jgi:hypothetical protein
MNLLIALVIGLSVLARSPSSDGGGAEPTLITAETMVGAWSGHWASENPAARGSAELVLARIPGRDRVVGQFTFLTGGVARSLRYEGRIDDRSVRFPLVGDGRIVLEAEAAARPGTAQRLKGEWQDERGALPAPRGVIELRRVK